MRERILLHHCCVVCTPKVLEFLNQKFSEVVGFWFNPNIYPEEEHNKRLEALKKFSETQNHQLILKTDISYNTFLKELKVMSIHAGVDLSALKEKSLRCKFCWTLRLTQTALESIKQNIKYFSTTLLISPYQDYQLLKQIGEEIGTKFQLEFVCPALPEGPDGVYRDFQHEFYAGKNEIHKLKLYIQKYCGCEFSINELPQNKPRIDTNKYATVR